MHQPSTGLASDHFKSLYLAKRVFPSAFGLKSFCDNEDSIERLPAIKTPKRLKSLIAPKGIITQIVQSSVSVRTNEVLEKYCQQKVRFFLFFYVTVEHLLSWVFLLEGMISL